MSAMVKCDKCEKLMYTDSREDKGAFIKMTADDPRFGKPTWQLEDRFPDWMEQGE